MRQSRRGCFYQSKEPKYIWKVYDIGTKLNGGTTGSISIRSTRTKKASTEFTYSNGTFTLTNPTSKTITNLSVGDYIVNIQTTTAGANTTSGSAIYKVTGKSGSSTITLSYTKYTSMENIQGSTYYYDVASDTLDYPVDGEQDGYWYVMVKGEYEMYVWDVYNIAQTYEVEERETPSSFTAPQSLYAASSYTFDEETGTFTLVNPSAVSITLSSTTSAVSNAFSKKYYSNRNPTTFTISYGVANLMYTPVEYEGSTYQAPTWDSSITFGKIQVQIKGTSTGTTVESQSSTAYPENNYEGDYWYVYSHSYIYKFDNR